VVEGLALRIALGDVPDSLTDVTILGLDMGLLQAGAGMRGEFENRLKSVINEIKASPTPIILFIDEAHTLIGAGGPSGGGDAANLLKPALARGELKTVAATTWSEYKKYFEKDAALARRFQLVKLDEPSVETSILILRGLKQTYEENHGVIVRDDAVIAAAELSSRYISGRQLPDKAVDLLDTSAARVKINLTAKPDVIEDRERRTQALERERKALERDLLTGSESAEHTERIQELNQELEEVSAELDALSRQWTSEKDKAAQLVDLRQTLFAPGNGSEDPAEIRAGIDALSAELAAVQADSPLIRTEVDADLVAKVVSDWTGVPLGNVLRDEARNVANLDDNLKVRIKGQDGAITCISEGIKSAKTGLKDPQQPLGVFLLVGPSGTGKTETGLALADLLFGGERFMVTINMSEFQERHTVSRLIGSPPGYVGYGEGGALTEAVRQRPYSVVLLDEVEKAHLEVMNLFYQVFDKGALSDGEGRNIDFKNTVLFLTSNLASDVITQLCEADEAPDVETVTSAIRPILSNHFKPALLARMTIVPYLTLGTEVIKDIVALKLGKVAKRLKDTHKMTFTYTSDVVDQIAKRCTEVETGARNIDFILHGTILPQISREILAGMGESGMPSQVTLGLAEDGTFDVRFQA
jgi:type VI secretion system protein VasG